MLWKEHIILQVHAVEGTPLIKMLQVYAVEGMPLVMILQVYSAIFSE